MNEKSWLVYITSFAELSFRIFANHLCENEGFHQYYGRDNLITNNIFAYNIKAQLQATRVESTHSYVWKQRLDGQGKIGSADTKRL